MRDFELKIAPTTHDDARRCPDAPDYLADSEDGAASVFVDGELVCVSDEYATAYMVPEAKATKEQAEAFLSAGLQFYGEAG